jgi:hypothetical protein
MVWNLIIPAAAALIGGRQSAKAAQSAANTSAAASDRASEVQREMFERNVELNAPFREAGVNALNKLVPLTDYQNFGMEQFQADPGYAFRMSEGMKALEGSAAARGGLLSGNTLRGVQRFGQDLASQEYQNAFNRYGIERERRMAPLQSLAGVGQTTSQQLGAAGTGFANTMGNIGMNQANVQGNATMARASAYNDTLNQLSRLYGGMNFGRPAGGARLPFGSGSGTFGEGEY